MAEKKTVVLKTAEEIELIRQSGVVLGKAHAEVAKLIKPGVRTKELDRVAYEFIKDHGGEPSFLGFGGFPASLCISVNEVVVHGFPSDYQLKEGDIITVDGGVNLKGYFSDSAFTYPVGEVRPEVMALLRTTYESLFKGMSVAKAGNRTGDIGFEVQQYCEARGYSVVRELVGHGVGHGVHEAPEVPNYGKRGKGTLLTPGMVIAIEPMINLGRKNVVQESDGWTIRTSDRKPSAHYEHTVAIRNGEPDVLTTFEYIEQIVKLF